MQKGKLNKDSFISNKKYSKKSPWINNSNQFRKPSLSEMDYKGPTVDNAKLNKDINKQMSKNKHEHKGTFTYTDAKIHQINRYRHLKNYKFTLNPKIRDRAAALIQKWWRKDMSKKIEYSKKVAYIQKIYRGYITRKDISDVIYLTKIYSKFFKILGKVLTQYVRRNYYPRPKFRKRQKMLNIFKIKLWQYFQRWKSKTKKLEMMKLNTLRMLKIRKGNRNNIILLKNYFDIWKLKNSKEINEENNEKYIKDTENKNKGIMQMLNGINKYAKRAGLEESKDNLIDYLYCKLQEKKLKKLIPLYEKKFKLNNLKKYFDIWRDEVKLQKLNEVKNKYIKKTLKVYTKKNDKENLRNKLNKMRGNIIREQANKIRRYEKISIYPNGIKNIRNYIRKKNFEQFKKYSKKLQIKKHLKKGYNHQLLRNYFNKWKNISNRNKFNEKRKKYLSKIINSNNRLNRFFSLKEYFNLWRKKVFFPKYTDDKINERQNFIDAIENYINKQIEPIKEEMLNRLNYYVNPKKKLQSLYDNIIKRDNKNKNAIIKEYFHKWRSKVNKNKIIDLKSRYLKSTERHNANMRKNKDLSNAFNKWRNISLLEKNKDQNKNNQKILEGLNKLNKLNQSAMRTFYDKLKNKKNLFMKGKIMSTLERNLKEPRVRLRNYFNKWRYKANEDKLKDENNNIRKNNKLVILKYVRNKKDQLDKYHSLLKYFLRWYYNTLLYDKDNIINLLKNINKGVNAMQRYLNDKYLTEPYEKILNSKINPKGKFKHLIKKYLNTNDVVNLKDAFLKWKSLLNYKNILSLKGKCLYNTKRNIENEVNKNELLKKFLFWKMLSSQHKRIPRGYLQKANESLYKAINKPDIKKAFNNIKTKGDNVSKKRRAEFLFNRSKALSKLALYKAFIEWYKRVNKMFKAKIVKTKKMHVYKIACNKSNSSLRKYLYKWLRYSKKYPTILNNISKGCDVLDNLYKKNLRNCFNKIKKHKSPSYLSFIGIKKVFPLKKKVIKNQLRKRFNQWRNLIIKLELLELKRKVKLYNIIKNNDNKELNKVKKAFDYMREKTVDYNNKFLKGFSVKDALLKNKLNLLKGIYLKNIFLRSYFTKWKKNLGKIAQKEYKTKAIKKCIIKSTKNENKVNLKKYYDKWRRKIICLESKDKRNKITKTLVKHLDRINKDILLKNLSEKEKLIKTNPLARAFYIWKDCINIRKDLIKCIEIKGKLSSLKEKDLLKCFFEKWKSEAQRRKMNDNSIIIQKFIRDKFYKYLENERDTKIDINNKNKNNQKDTSKSMLNILKGKTEQEKKSENDNLLKSRYMNNKIGIMNDNFSNQMNNDKTQYLDKNYNGFGSKGKIDLLKGILMKLQIKYNKKLNEYFYKYRNQALKKKLKIKAIRLSNFIHKNYLIYKWKKLSSELKKLNKPKKMNKNFIKIIITKKKFNIPKKVKEKQTKFQFDLNKLTFNKTNSIISFQPPLTHLIHSKKNSKKENLNKKIENHRKKILLIPSLVQLLSKLISKRRGKEFELNDNQNTEQMSIKLKDKFNASFQLQKKKALFNQMKNAIKANKNNKFCQLVRKVSFKKLGNVIRESKRMNDLMYILQLSFMFKKISEEVYLKKIIRVWERIVRLNIIKKKHLEEIDKNFSQTYDILADELFGNNSNSPGIQTQVQEFFENLEQNNQKLKKNN